jgi:predicted membrane protein
MSKESRKKKGEPKIGPYLMTRRKANALSNGAFLICLGILAFLNIWWPWILVAVWVNIGMRQYLTGRKYDFFISSFLILGFAFLTFFPIRGFVLPVIFLLGGLYLIFREYFFTEDTDGEETTDAILDDTDLNDQ